MRVAIDSTVCDSVLGTARAATSRALYTFNGVTATGRAQHRDNESESEQVGAVAIDSNGRQGNCLEQDGLRHNGRICVYNGVTATGLRQHCDAAPDGETCGRLRQCLS